MGKVGNRLKAALGGAAKFLRDRDLAPVGKCRVGEPGLQPRGILRSSGRPRAGTRRQEGLKMSSCCRPGSPTRRFPTGSKSRSRKNFAVPSSTAFSLRPSLPTHCLRVMRKLHDCSGNDGHVGPWPRFCPSGFCVSLLTAANLIITLKVKHKSPLARIFRRQKEILNKTTRYI